jgi:SulP family sulfate permease
VVLVDARPDLNLPTPLLAVGALAIIVFAPCLTRFIPSPHIIMLTVTLG